MNTSLETDIRAAFERLAAQTTIDPDAEFCGRAVVVDHATPRRRALTPVLAVAAALALVGGVVTVSYLRSDSHGDPLAWAATDDASVAVGLFPAGDTAAVSAAGYVTPQAAVDAYLADRTQAAVLPAGLEVTYSVGESAVPAHDRRAFVGFSLLATTSSGSEPVSDSGDGLLVAEQVAPLGSAERWVVLGGGSALMAIDRLDYRNGRLTGSFTNELDGGTTIIDVVDAVTGQRLASTTGTSVSIDGLTARAVSVRLWNSGRDGVAPQAGFVEALVQDGGTVHGVGFASLSRPYSETLMAQYRAAELLPPFDTGPVSGFENLEVGQMVTVLAEGGTTITIHLEEGERPLCVDIQFGERSSGTVCFTREGVAGQKGYPSAKRAYFNADSMDGAKVLVGGVVPDAVTEIRSQTGEVIVPVRNVWWDEIVGGTQRTYTLMTADGRTTELRIG